MAARRVAIATCALAGTTKQGITLVLASGVSGAATQGYLKARGGNSAAIFISEFSTNNDNEPRFRLAAGETLPIRLDYEGVASLYAKGSTGDVLEFVADASE